MKKVLSYVLVFVLGIGITVGASLVYKANEIEFNPKNNTWNVTNVEDAINDIYDNSYKTVTSFDDVYSVDYYNGTRKIYTSTLSLDTGVYLCTATYANSTAEVSEKNKLVTSGQTITISNCDNYTELKSIQDYQTSSALTTSSSYGATVLIEKIFVCEMTDKKDISIVYGFADGNTKSPVRQNTTCTKIQNK